MSYNSRICEPCKVSEVLAGACLVGRPASALGALLGFNTHLDGPQRKAIVVSLKSPLARSQSGRLTGQLVWLIRLLYMPKRVGSDSNPHPRAGRRANAIVDGAPRRPSMASEGVFFLAFVPFSHSIRIHFHLRQVSPETLAVASD